MALSALVILTEQLSKAIKLHIPNLIDLASDKRETKGFLVDRRIPSLQKILPTACIDVLAVVAQIAAEIRRLVRHTAGSPQNERVFVWPYHRGSVTEL